MEETQNNKQQNSPLMLLLLELWYQGKLKIECEPFYYRKEGELK